MAFSRGLDPQNLLNTSLVGLHDGIEIPEYSTHIPWLIDKPELCKYVPAEALAVSDGHWPQLQFTLLGVPATYSFNFVTHPESKLLEVQFYQPALEDIEDAFRKASDALRECLGPPNEIDRPEYHRLLWRDDKVWVDLDAGVPEDPSVPRIHKLRVVFHAGSPRAWIGKNEPTLTQVKRLINLMPEVEVVEVLCKPAHTGLSIRIKNPSSLARLAHVGHAANVRMNVWLDEYRLANGELSKHDPSGILYHLDIRGPREPEPDGHTTTLQRLGIYLVDELRDLGLLENQEASKLEMAFNNHTSW